MIADFFTKPVQGSIFKESCNIILNNYLEVVKEHKSQEPVGKPTSVR